MFDMMFEFKMTAKGFEKQSKKAEKEHLQMLDKVKLVFC